MDASNTHKSASLLPSQRKLIYFLIAFGFVFYLLVLGYILLATQFMLRFTYLIPLVAIFALLTNRIKQFILDWSAFYLIIVVYDTFRALADNLNSRVNYTLLLLIERKLFFGSTPTEFLQSNFYQLLTGVPGMFLTSIYLLHFILPVMLLLYWWYTNMKLFRWYASTLALTSIVAFVFFLIFPAAPPWMIAKQNVIQANRLLMENLDVLFANSQPLVFQLSANPVAPFPSLHTAYPAILLFISIIHRSRLYSLISGIYLVLIIFTLVAFAEHYVIDTVAGVLLALICTKVVLKYQHNKQTKLSKK